MNHQNKPRIILIGATGQVGFELIRTLAPLGQVFATARKDSEWILDLTDLNAIDVLFAQVKPHLVVNASAYTNVNLAEQESDLAYQINALAVERIGQLAQQINAPVIHYSTDYVYPGTGVSPWQENALTKPLNQYGKTKLAGEQRLIASGAEAIILRTSWVYGMRGGNFLRTMRSLFETKTELSIVNDEIGAPTWSRHIAEATALILAQSMSRSMPFCFTQKAGIYNLSSAGFTSWFEFAQAILTLSDADCRLSPILSKDYPAPAQRPLNSRLDNQKLANTYQIQLPHWKTALEQCLSL